MVYCDTWEGCPEEAHCVAEKLSPKMVAQFVAAVNGELLDCMKYTDAFQSNNS
jgi:hypothetical protein